MSHRALATTLTVALSGMLATACSPPGQEILHHDSHGLLAGSCASGPGGSDATCSCANGYTWTGSYEGTDGLINALRENCGGGDPDYSGGGGQTDPHGYFVGADPNSTGGGGGSSSGTSVDPLATNLKAAFDEWDLLKSLLNLMDDPCAYLRPLAHFENMYYARGGNIGAHLGARLTDAGKGAAAVKVSGGWLCDA